LAGMMRFVDVVIIGHRGGINHPR